MGTYSEINNYLEQAEQLEPVFAGLLHDGAISYRDAIALIFFLVEKRVLLIHWKPNEELKKIEAFEIIQSTYPLDYAQAVIDLLKKHSENNLVSIETVGKLIQSEEIQRCIQSNSLLIRESNITSTNVTFYESLGKRTSTIKIDELGRIDSHKKVISYNNYTQTALGMTRLVTVAGTILCLFQLQKLLSFINQKITVANLTEFSLALGPFVLVSLLLVFLYSYPKIKYKPSISFTFRNQDISKIAGKYTYLYEYIKLMPIDNNNLSNVFLPYSIAFGFNTYWNDQFVKGLPEPEYISTPLDYKK